MVHPITLRVVPTPFPNTFYGLFTRWICDIDPTDLGYVPSAALKYGLASSLTNGETEKQNKNKSIKFPNQEPLQLNFPTATRHAWLSCCADRRRDDYTSRSDVQSRHSELCSLGTESHRPSSKHAARSQSQHHLSSHCKHA